MAGHSHWAGIKHKKGRADKERSKIFSKLSREITVAAKLGDKDPNLNPRLRAAIHAARSANMPNDNIIRAIDKSKLNDVSNLEEIRYEGFGNEKIALIIEALTDNKNRTASKIREIFQKNGGNLGTQGSASHNFKHIGIIRVDSKEIDANTMLEIAINSGADEFYSNDKFYEIHCNKENIYSIRKIMEEKINNFLSTDVEWYPINKIKLYGEKALVAKKFIELLEEDDDVRKVYSNLVIER
tara:strand:- start:5194 stop:5916 length:723 start_codon:yes stop_codon:yes gene_type:complete